MIDVSILKNTVQEYAWGSRTAIARLLGQKTPSLKPQAELWMGAHPKAPSRVLCGSRWAPLPQWIGRDPQGILGERTASRFAGSLPFLFKVLAAERPLSIQAHPGPQQAREGFAREEALKIPLDAPHRNYRDPSHKPEILCALTPFWALCGFRPRRRIQELAEQLRLQGPQWAAVMESLASEDGNQGLKGFFNTLMRLEAGARERIVAEAVEQARCRAQDDPAFHWMVRLYEEHPEDVGVLAPLFLNLKKLRPGEALFLPAGQLHAYLEGTGIELMANSDNVLRGGLTSKHVDVAELLKVLRFTESGAPILHPRGTAQGEAVYETSAEEFALSSVLLDESTPSLSLEVQSVEMLLCIEGKAEITSMSTNKVIPLGRGDSVIVPALAGGYRMEGRAFFYRASVGPGALASQCC